MKTEQMLRLQAYLDNEVSSAEGREIASWIARDAEAKALYEELAATKSLLEPENELAANVPDSREFYWSKIAREIERVEREPAREHSPRPWWIRILAPVAGAAALALFVFTSISVNGPGSPGHMGFQKEDSKTDSSITFYSPEQKMTVVWIPSGRVEADANVDLDEDEVTEPVQQVDEAF
jgi:anti-sigma factor RsiW